MHYYSVFKDPRKSLLRAKGNSTASSEPLSTGFGGIRAKFPQAAPRSAPPRNEYIHRSKPGKVPPKEFCAAIWRWCPLSSSHSFVIRFSSLSTRPPAAQFGLKSSRRGGGFADHCRPGKIAMRRIIIFGIFGLGLYYLWYNNDRTAQLIAIGVMGVALLLEFASKD
jgi:hypothetical protein